MNQKLEIYLSNHRQIIDRLFNDFQQKSQILTEEADNELDLIPEEDEETRQETLTRYQQTLNQLLSNYNQAISKANRQLANAVENLSKSTEQTTQEQLEAELNQIIN